MTATIDFDATLAAINGMSYTHDGIHGIIRVEQINGMTEISHHPSSRGRRTEAYKKVRRELGDDWSTSWQGEAPLEFWSEVEKRGLVRYT